MRSEVPARPKGVDEVVGWCGRAAGVGGTGILAVVLALGSSGCVAGVEAGTRQSSSPRSDDLAALSTWVDGEASFTDDVRREAHERIAAILEEGPAEDLPGFYLQVASVVGLADNGHSNLTTRPAYGFGLVPIRTFWFSDGLYVVRARADLGHLLGGRIESIGGHTPDALVEAFDRYHGGTAGHFRQYFATPYLLSPPLLHAAGLTPSGSEVKLSVAVDGGAPQPMMLESEKGASGPRPGNGWRLLVPEPTVNEAGWVSVVPESLPVFLRDHSESFRYEPITEMDAAYIQLRSNIDRDGVAVRDFADQARDRIEKDAPRHVILDNRFNPGGDLTRTAAFARSLPSLVPEDGRVYVLTSNATFSAGIYTSFYPEAADSVKTVVVGEHVGDRTRFWAESRGPSVLPNTGWAIGRSLQTHDLGVGCTTPDCHFGSGGRERFDIAVGDLEPDVRIGMTFAEYRAGVDPLLDWIRMRASR